MNRKGYESALYFVKHKMIIINYALLKKLESSRYKCGCLKRFSLKSATFKIKDTT